MAFRDSIMIVDDDAFMRTLLTSKLEKAGYMVTTAADAGEGIIQAQGLRPRLIISDMLMPVWGGGGELLTEIRKNQKLAETPVIFITGVEMREIQEKHSNVLKDPKARVLVKPINWVMLEQAIFELLGETKPFAKEGGQ